MADAYLGSIKLFSFNFPPKGWAFCDGQTMAINQNQALFALLGTTYGGNGINTFALPNLKQRIPVHFGQGAGLSNRILGETAGQSAVTLVSGQIPSHTHNITVSSGAGTLASPISAQPAKESSGQTAIYTGRAADAVMDPAAVGNAGQSQPHDNMQPYLVLRFCIALVGIFPSRP